jgi:hypothetical protein
MIIHPRFANLFHAYIWIFSFRARFSWNLLIVGWCSIISASKWCRYLATNATQCSHPNTQIVLSDCMLQDLLQRLVVIHIVKVDPSVMEPQNALKSPQFYQVLSHLSPISAIVSHSRLIWSSCLYLQLPSSLSLRFPDQNFIFTFYLTHLY